MSPPKASSKATSLTPWPRRRLRSHRRAVIMGTTAIVGFAFTLLVASLMLLLNTGPVRLPALHRAEAGAFLFFMPLLALTLAIVVEATRIALRRRTLPDTEQTRRISWAETDTRD